MNCWFTKYLANTTFTSLPSCRRCNALESVILYLHVPTFLSSLGGEQSSFFQQNYTFYLFLHIYIFPASAELPSDPRERDQRGGGGGDQAGGQAVEPDQGDCQGGGRHQGAGEPLPGVSPQHPAADGCLPWWPHWWWWPHGATAGVPTRASGLPAPLASQAGELQIRCHGIMQVDQGCMH